MELSHEKSFRPKRRLLQRLKEDMQLAGVTEEDAKDRLRRKQSGKTERRRRRRRRPTAVKHQNKYVSDNKMKSLPQ